MKWTNYRGKDVSGGHESVAEVDLYLTFQKAKTEGVLPSFHTGHRVVLLDTEPDFTFLEQKLVVYVDGPPHDKAKRGAKDDVQNGYLTDQGWKVLRVHYDGGKVSTEKKKVVVEWVRLVLASPRTGHLWEFDVDRGEEL